LVGELTDALGDVTPVRDGLRFLLTAECGRHPVPQIRAAIGVGIEENEGADGGDDQSADDDRADPHHMPGWRMRPSLTSPTMRIRSLHDWTICERIRSSVSMCSRSARAARSELARLSVWAAAA